MTLMELPIAELMTQPQSKPRSETEVRSVINELLDTTHAGVMQRLADEGFTNEDVRRLDDWLSKSFDETHLAETLALLLRKVNDIGNEEELKVALDRWMEELQWYSVAKQVIELDSPDEAVALGYAIRHLWRVADSTIWFESSRRPAAQERKPERDLTQEEVKQGVELAEAGLSLDAFEWPTY